jgi:FkbM family methyltransferase
VLEDTRELNQANYSILPRAYHPNKDRVNFPADKYYKTISLLDENKNVKKESVKTTSIEDIVKNYSLDNFFLHVDIEGSERLLFQEMDIMSDRCKGILIELHPDKIDSNRCSNKLEEHFDLIAQRDNVKLYTSKINKFQQ